MTELLLKEDRDGVRLLTLNRPEKKNAINNPLWDGIREAFEETGLLLCRKADAPEVLEAALDQFGEALLNTRSTTWRSLDAAERAKPPMALIMAHPALMKRPLVAVDKQLFLGWNSAVQEEVKALL